MSDVGPKRDETEETSDGASRHELALSLARRGFVLAGLGFLAACASQKPTTGSLARAGSDDGMPAGIWTQGGEVPKQKWQQPAPSSRAPTVVQPRTVTPNDKPAVANAAIPSGFTGKVIPRMRWTYRQPDLDDMRPMLPVTAVTVHHEGMEPFTDTSSTDTIERLRRVWNGHEGRGFGDIGYHYVIDRSGRIWEGRSLKYQGAHVRAHNEGNIGVMCLGNFDEQKVSEAQRAALEHQLKMLCAKYRVKRSMVKTHKEWNPTACPGRDLQRVMGPIRSRMS